MNGVISSPFDFAPKLQLTITASFPLTFSLLSSASCFPLSRPLFLTFHSFYKNNIESNQSNRASTHNSTSSLVMNFNYFPLGTFMFRRQFFSIVHEHRGKFIFCASFGSGCKEVGSRA
jgi:hypothetical protein